MPELPWNQCSFIILRPLGFISQWVCHNAPQSGCDWSYAGTIILTPVYPDSKVHGANMGPIWGQQDPGRPHVGPMNFAIWVAWPAMAGPLALCTGMCVLQDYNFWHTVRCRYHVINFLKNINKRHPTARPLGRGMGCLLWIQHLIDIQPQVLKLWMQYVTILDRVIMALDCISINHEKKAQMNMGLEDLVVSKLLDPLLLTPLMEDRTAMCSSTQLWRYAIHILIHIMV